MPRNEPLPDALVTAQLLAAHPEWRRLNGRVGEMIGEVPPDLDHPNVIGSHLLMLYETGWMRDLSVPDRPGDPWRANTQTLVPDDNATHHEALTVGAALGKALLYVLTTRNSPAALAARSQ